MILVNLPFPPLPLCGIGEEGEDRIMSSHDLLSRAIASSMLKPPPNAQEAADAQRIVKEKENILVAMMRQVAQVWKQEDKSEDERIDESYSSFCHYFREYMKLYPGSVDLRISPWALVDAKHVVCRQGISHLKARTVASVPPEEGEEGSVPPEEGEEGIVGEPSPVCAGMRYKDIIKAYACDFCHTSEI